LFELYGLVMVLDALEALGFTPSGVYGIIRPGRSGEVATFTKGPITADVFFDQSPPNAKSQYQEILARYEGLPDGARPRPDVLVRFKSAETERIVAVEAKETESADYARSSVYKVLGYLQDYSEMWAATPPGVPKVILLFPAPVNARDS